MDKIAAIVPALKAEAAALERDLKKDTRYARLLLIYDLLDTYENEHPAPSKNGARGIESDESTDPTNDEIRAYLRQHGTTPKRTILKHLLSKGLMADAENPSKALGKRLWRMKDVEGDGEGNYGLKSPPKQFPKDAAA